MSTQVPTPLYAKFPVPGIYPIDTEPEEPTPKKPEGGLMSKLDRLLGPWSTTQRQPSPTPTSSATTNNPESAPGAVESVPQSEEPSDPTLLRILSWNIWFERLFKEERTSALIAIIKSLSPLPDVCCFQECTSGFESQLLGDDWWMETWAMTKCKDQFAVTRSHYGTMVFVRRGLVGEMGFKARAWFEPFETTQTGRGLLVLELTPPRSKHPVGGTNSPSSRNSLTLEPSIYQLLIGTSHLDYTPEIRAAQFASSISTLSAAPASVFCGDTNIDTYPELEPLLSAGYADSWLDTHPDFANSPNLREVGVTFGIAGLRQGGSPIGSEGPPRRLDYVMARGMKVKGCGLVGGELIPREKWATAPEEQKLDFEVYVSDHLGVLADVELA